MADTAKVNVALLAVPEVTASSVYAMYDLFSAVGREWSLIMGGVPGEQLMNPYIVARDSAPIRSGNGIWVKPDYAFDESPQPVIVCVPDFSLLPGERCSSGMEVEVAWLRACHAAGATLASACTSAVLLAETGLLNGFEATTHWAYVESLTRHYPMIRVHPNRSLVVSGPGQSIVMGGGATNYLDLTMYLIGRFVGPRAAMEVAKAYLIQWHDVGQQPFASLLVGRQVEDASIRKCQQWAAEHYDHTSPVGAMIKLSGLSERTFIRRFTRATGQSPLEYVHAVRLEEAKQMLETEETSVEAIATEVGYEDASFFNHLFRRKVGLTPAQYRRRFGILRRHLSQPPSPSPGRSARKA
jgi:transcriptional regulator GlxA family with amidase domain